jgi:hypothetical protein
MEIGRIEKMKNNESNKQRERRIRLTSKKSGSSTIEK